MIRVKSDVIFHPDSFAHQQVTRILRQADELAPTGYDITVTSACDGLHKDGSKHYTGKAFDFRTRDFPANASIKTWAKRLQRRLGDEYFVLVESNHLHVQWNG